MQVSGYRMGAIYRTVSTSNPFLFAGAYLVTILLFASAYCLLAASHPTQDFYAPYARYEPSGLADKSGVEFELRAAFLRAFEANSSPSQGWVINRKAFEVINLDVPKDGIVTFTVVLWAMHEVHGLPASVAGPYDLSLDTAKSIYYDAPATICHSVKPPAMTDVQAENDFNFDLLLTPSPLYRQPHSLCWASTDEVKLNRLLSGWRGDPRGLRHFYWRMLYFSVSTITTLGYGDIVPLSGAARFLVGLEAMLGGLLTGLFLNAVAWQASRSGAADR